MQEIVFNHKPVLFEETIESLGIRPDGTYIDGTAGGGGHSGAILERLTTGKLLSIDRDPDAIAVVRARLSKYPGSIVAMGNFSEMDRIAAEHGISSVDGVLLDIGVSSFQLDTAERGFSYHSDAPLDMRMSKSGTSAADLVNTLSWQQLAEIISRYGEDKSAARIAVNGELDALQAGLRAAFGLLKPGGRLAVITFHSLEDRIVKQQMNAWCTGCTCPKDFPVCVCGKKPQGRLLYKKGLAPGEAELRENPRARSARLRVIEKIAYIEI